MENTIHLARLKTQAYNDLMVTSFQYYLQPLGNKNGIYGTKNNRKLFNAFTLLADVRYSIKEVAFLSGFQDPKYFSRCFKKMTGITPSAYKELITDHKSETRKKKSKEKFIKQAVFLVIRNLTNSYFSVDDFASVMNVSRSTLYRNIKLCTDLSPFEFIQSFRLKKVEKIVKSSEYSISDIAHHIGFNDSKYFSRYFKTKFGLPPSRYRQLQ